MAGTSRSWPREDSANGVRGKGAHGWVPITPELVRLDSDYMHEEYGDLDCDYVFVNLWAGRIGHAMRYVFLSSAKTEAIHNAAGTGGLWASVPGALAWLES